MTRMCREYNTFLIAFNAARLEEIAFMGWHHALEGWKVL